VRKSSIFISATLTTFALAILYSVVSAYRANINAPEAATQPIATLAPEPTDTPTQTVVTPEEAAQLAVQVIGHDDLLSAESANINGVDAYKITFKNNDIVYVGLMGRYSPCRWHRSLSRFLLLSKRTRTTTMMVEAVVEVKAPIMKTTMIIKRKR
jgi:hypothetical protein